MKKPLIRSACRILLLVLLLLPSTAGRTVSHTPAVNSTPTLLVKLRKNMAQKMAFAFPAPESSSRDNVDTREKLRYFAGLQLLLLTLVALWWRNRLGHWGLR